MTKTLSGLSGLLLASALLVSGCASHMMDNMDTHPSDRGLLHALQTAGMQNPTSGGYAVKWSTPDGKLTSQADQDLTLQVLDPQGQPVEKFTPDMTKLLHLIVVNRDLSVFAHVHPEYNGNGTFEITHRFPMGGDYLLIAEFAPEGRDTTVVQQWVTVAGSKPSNEKIMPDTNLTKIVNGLEVTLTAGSSMSGTGDEEIASGKMTMLNFRVVDAKTHQPVTNLEPYLGTLGHCVILDAQATQYLHVHAMDGMGQGPDVMFHTQFPKAGIYKVWGQFQYQGQVVAVPFVVQVK